MMKLLPTADFCGIEMTRLIIGGNPFSGNSHVNQEYDESMRNYYTTENIKKALRRCVECGINTVQLRADTHVMRILREFRNEGGKLNWIAQTASEVSSFEGNIKAIVKNPEAAAIYHHGSVTDELYKKGKISELKDRFKIMRDSGLPVGLGTHMPEIIKKCEDEAWDVDFYMACVYNLSRIDRVSSAITGIANSDEPFFDEDIPVMYRLIKEVKKPTLAFKILGATRRCGSDADIKSNFTEAFENIKENDCVIVGVYQKEKDQIEENSRYVREIFRTRGL
jgi:hypothetical protein